MLGDCLLKPQSTSISFWCLNCSWFLVVTRERVLEHINGSLAHRAIKELTAKGTIRMELLAKCNQLGRGEALSCERLEKALEKIDRLKVCLSVLAFDLILFLCVSVIISS
uniref:Uncharacterized protein n=1 Tax=Noccaea caerulescens TaxID=107243 RepID=A0A1J3F6U1_NOCCA